MFINILVIGKFAVNGYPFWLDVWYKINHVYLQKDLFYIMIEVGVNLVTVCPWNTFVPHRIFRQLDAIHQTTIGIL